MFNLSTLIRPNIAKLEPYRCARDDFKEGILLDANENTHGPALATVSSIEEDLYLNRYPDPHQIELKQQIADYRNTTPNKHFSGEKITPQNLCLGVGSDESVDMLMRCVCVPSKDKLLVCPPTYGMYSICASVNDVEMVKVPLKFPGFQLDTEAVLAKLQSDSSIKLAYFTSPGNPTCALLDVDVVVEFAVRAAKVWNGLVVVDEAYIDFTKDVDGFSQSVSTLVNKYPNLVVLQTLSKAFGLAGIRLGITYANEDLSGYLNAMKYPYNISSLTSAIAMRSTSADGLKVMQDSVNEIAEQRAYVLEQLQKIPGVGRNLGGLDANFILVEILDRDGNPSNEVAKNVYNTMAVNERVVIRFRGTELNCTGCLRISIGTKRENAILLEKIAACIAAARK